MESKLLATAAKIRSGEQMPNTTPKNAL
jgi:hypothetical protein